MSTYLFDQLDDVTRSTLQSVGVSNDIQLAEIEADTLIGDIKQYQEFFPDTAQAIDLNQVPRLCEIARESLTHQGIAFTPPVRKKVIPVAAIMPDQTEQAKIIINAARLQKDEGASIPVTQSMRVAVNEKPERDVHKQGTRNAIRYRRSFTCYLGAIATCFIYPLILSALLLPFAMLLYPITLEMAKMYMGGVFVIWLIYYFCTPFFRCQVCYINIYSFRKFPRHKHAHRFLLLNTAIPTALTIILRRWFRCPACGTAQKLFKGKKRGHRR